MRYHQDKGDVVEHSERQRIYDLVEPYLLALRGAVSEVEYESDREELQALFDLLDGLAR